MRASPPGEIAARGTVVRHEQGISHKRGVAYHVGQTGGRVARRVQHPPFEPTNGEDIALFEERIELAAVSGKLRACIESLTEYFLHIDDMGTNTGLAA